MIERYITLLSSHSAHQWFDGLIHLLREIATKENLTQNEMELLHRLFQVVPRQSGDRDRLEFLLDRLSSK